MNALLTSSPLNEINDALRSHNPFAQPPFVNANNVWGKGFPDVENLNSHASDAVFKALEDIRIGRYSTTSILITAQNGTGKTHIISRIRHRLQVQGGALFVFANKFNDLNQVKPSFQQILADSLSNIGSQGVKQWQELAAAMANEAAQFVGLPTIAAKEYVKRFENSDEEQDTKWVSQLTKAYCKSKVVQDPDVVRAIFWTLSDEQAPYASNWLAGKEIAQFKANELRLPNQNQSFDTVLQILALISEYNELVICFDELDSLEFNDAGLHKAQVVANLIKELVENLKRGVILTVIMPGVWTQEICQVLPRGVVDKMKTYGEPLDLKYLDSDSTVDLVSFFLKEYYDVRELIPPHAVYPFEEEELRKIGRGKPTIREVLTWCKENCKPLELVEEIKANEDELKSEDPVEIPFTTELNENLTSQLDNNQLLADALFFSFQRLIGQTVENVTLREVTTGVGKRGGKDDYLNFKILGEEEGKNIAIGVAVLQYDGGKALGAGFKRLLDKDNRFGLTRGCLVRSKSKSINSHFKKTHLNPLIEKGGEFVGLKEEEIKPLIAIRAVHQKRDSDYQVTEEQISQFISEKGETHLLGLHSPLLKEILSDPSYQIPEIQDEPEALPEDLKQEDTSDSIEVIEAEDLAELLINV